MSKRNAEDELAYALSIAGEPFTAHERQYRYVPGRKFAADFAWPDARLLVEVQGGIYSGEAHGSISGIKADIERLNLATLNGYRLLRFIPPRAKDMDEWIGETLATIEEALK